MRRAGTLGLICALALTGCSAAVEGAVGVRLDAAGRLVGVFDWCPDKPGTDTVILYLGRDGGGVGDEVVRLDRDSGRAATSEDVVLPDPAGAWVTKMAPATLDDDTVYHLRAWNEDDGAVEDFPFRIRELRGRTGSDVILTKRYVGEEQGGYATSYRTPEDFARYAETVCG